MICCQCRGPKIGDHTDTVERHEIVANEIHQGVHSLVGSFNRPRPSAITNVRDFVAASPNALEGHVGTSRFANDTGTK